jgi:peptidoglycan hydrolase CwlO-like protein
MGDASNNIARMLAVHEERLDRQDTSTEELFTLVEKRKTELQIDIKELHSRITTVTRELAVDISDTEHRVITAVCSNMTDMKTYIAELNKKQNDERQLLNARVNELEKWKWIIMGGSIILGSFSHEIVAILTK